MAGFVDEHERTMAFAEIALGQIKSLRLTAVPRNYEIWYVYATGSNPALNKIVNEVLARQGKLTESDLDHIYQTYLSPTRTTDRIDKVGVRIIHEIDDVMNVITDALGLTTNFSNHLADANQRLTQAASREHIKSVIEMLVRSTHELQ